MAASADRNSMGRLKSLLFKELQQHWLAWVSLLILQGFAVLLLALRAIGSPTSISLLEAYAGQMIVFMPIAAMVLGNRLVVAEYHGRTQLFVESLPIRRSEMALLKYALGLLVLLLGCAFALLLAAGFASVREPIGASFLGLVAARSALFVFSLWGFFFAMGFTGRLRVPIYLGLLLAVGVLDSMTDLELEHFGPFALADPTTLPFERLQWPLQAMLESLAFGALWLGVGLALAVIKEGSIAESLSRRMSHREKAIIAVLFVLLLMAFTLYDERRQKEPYAFDLPEVVASDELPVEILYLLPRLRPDAEALRDYLDERLLPLVAMLKRPLPDLRVAYYGSLDGETFDWATLHSNDGLLVRANLARDILQADALLAEVVPRVVDEMTDGSAEFEPRSWVRDGIGPWWAAETDRAAVQSERPLTEVLGVVPATSTEVPATSTEVPSDRDPSSMECPPQFLQAVWSAPRNAAGEVTIDRSTVEHWWRLREARGTSAAKAMARTGLDVLEAQEGVEGVVQLMQRLWSEPLPNDLRILWRRQPMASLFEDATGMPYDDFLGEWSRTFDSWRLQKECAAALLPKVDGEVEFDGSSRSLSYRVRFAEMPADGTLVRLLHGRLGPFDAPIDDDDLRREEHLWPGGTDSSFTLDGVYGQGGRVFVALEVELPQLAGRPLRLFAQRLGSP